MKKKRVEVKVGDLVKSGFVANHVNLRSNQYYVIRGISPISHPERVFAYIKGEGEGNVCLSPILIKKYVDSTTPLSCVYLLPGHGWEVYSYSGNLEKILE